MLSGDEAKVKVLRKGQVVEVTAKVENLSFGEKRRSVDFVYLSGMFLQEMAKAEMELIRPGLPSGVQVAGMIETSDTQFRAGAYPPPGSVITAVVFGDKEYKVSNLFDLKKAINENRDQKVVRLRALTSNLMQVSEETIVPVRSRRTGAPFIDGIENVFILPMRDVITPAQFSISRFKKQFSFELDAADTRDWRPFVKKYISKPCELALEPKTTEG
jgi:hypothetical protein